MTRTLHSQATLRDVLRVIFRHRRKACAVFLGVIGVVMLGTLLAPRTYRSEGKLLVRLGRENVTLDPTASPGESPIVAVPQFRENEINSVTEILRSRVLAEKVVDAVGADAILKPDRQSSRRAVDSTDENGGWSEQAGKQLRTMVAAATDRLKRLRLTTPLSDRDKAVYQVSKNLKVDSVSKSSVIQISYEGPSPELSQAIVATLIDCYLDEHLRLNRTRGSHAFFAEQTALLHSQLAHKEEELRDLKADTGLISPTRQREVLVERLGRLEDDLVQVEAERSATVKKVAALRTQLAALPEKQIAARITGVGNQAAELMREQFYALQIQEQEAAAKYTQSHPVLQRIREQVARAEEILDRQEPTRTHVTTGPHHVYEQVQQALLAEIPMLEALQAKNDELRSQAVAVRGELKTLGENELRIAKVQREIELLDADYRKYAANLEQARIDGQLEAQRISSINVAQPATHDPRPVRPRAVLNLIIGTLLATFSSLVVVLLAEHFDHSFQKPEDIEKELALPALASIPRLRRPQLVPNGRN